MSTASLSYATQPVTIWYGQDIEEELAHLNAAIGGVPDLRGYNPRWLALQLLEGDETLLAEVRATEGGAAVLQALEHSQKRLQRIYGEEVDVVVTDRRYTFVHQLAGSVLTRSGEQQETLSDKIDKVVTHRILGIPIFLTLMWIVFKITADVSAPYLDWIDLVISGPITRWTGALLGVAGLGDTWVASLLLDGVIAGVGGVLAFVPVLMALYLALAVLEDSGYMARAAFVMDRLMQVLGLHGKSFLPMIIGFGCNVPAIYATRTLENEKDRILTGLLVPFMSCGARLPVYVLLAAVFFPVYGGVAVFGLYLLGIVVAIALGLVLKYSLFKDKLQTPFIMELPPYRMPTLRNVWFHMWGRTSAFIRKAWTIIMATSIVLWFLMAIPTDRQSAFAETDIDTSAFATVAGAVAPIFEPLGFGSWEASGALTAGFVAKEVVVSTLAQTYGLTAMEAEEPAEPTTFVQDVSLIVTSFGSATLDTLKSIPLIVGINLFAEDEEPLPGALLSSVHRGFEESSGGHGALAALAFMVFVLLYTPCAATIAAARQELGNRWMWFSVLGQFVLAWLGAFIVFQGGLLLGMG